jgi:hypothetical protein
MFRPVRALVSVVVALCGGLPVLAQQDAAFNGPLPGEYLLGLDLAYGGTRQDGVETEYLLLHTDVSRFFGRPHQLGLELTSRFDAVEHGGHAGSFFVGPLYNYNWYPGEATCLYAGGRVGVAFGDVTGTPDHSDLAYGFQIGLRQWITPRTALKIEPRYTRIETDTGGLTEVDRFDLLVGLNLVL